MSCVFEQTAILCEWRHHLHSQIRWKTERPKAYKKEKKKKRGARDPWLRPEERLGTLEHKHRKKGRNKQYSPGTRIQLGRDRQNGGVEAWAGEIVGKGVYLSLAEQPTTHHKLRGIGGSWKSGRSPLPRGGKTQCSRINCTEMMAVIYKAPVSRDKRPLSL